MVQVSLPARTKLESPSASLPDWLATVSTGRSPEEIAIIRRGAELAMEAHRGQTRRSGGPFVDHAFSSRSIRLGNALVRPSRI
jgi:(p)ppGpp synthase/HD superfamily hydrolase